MNSLVYLLPEVYLVVAASVLLLWGSVVATSSYYSYPQLARPTASVSAAVLGLVARLLVTGPGDFTVRPLALEAGDRAVGSVASSFHYDPRVVLLQLRRVLATVGTLRASHSYRGHRRLNAFEYPILRLLALLGRRFLVASSDLRRFYLALELQSLALYGLAAFRRGSAYSTEAGLKYFRLGAFASGLFLLGASLIYGFLGTTSYEALGRILADDNRSSPVRGPVLAGFVRIVSAVRFKLAVAPFHRWSPDVIEGSPSSSSRFFAAVTKIAGRGALLTLCFGPFNNLWISASRRDSFSALAALSRRVAALAALNQRRWKRFLAYSAIGHRGFRFRGFSSATIEGVSATLRYLTIYVVGSVGLWATLIATRRSQIPHLADDTDHSINVVQLEDNGENRPAVYFTDLAGLAYSHPSLAATYAVSRFSRAGVPPRSGFLAKLGVFFAAREASQYLLGLVAIRASVVGAYYYLRVIKIRYFEGESTQDPQYRPRGAGSSRVIALSRFVTVFLRLNPSLLAVRCHRGALALVA